MIERYPGEDYFRALNPNIRRAEENWEKKQMKEVVIVPTYKRPELLFCCLTRLRRYCEIPIHVFPDRGTYYDTEVLSICEGFGARAHLVPDNDWYGNTANVMEAFRWAYNAGYERVFYVESDVMVHSDFFDWHRTQHEDYPDIFASMAWIFNRHAPIAEDLLFQPWYYSIGVCFSRDKLALVVEHSTPKYFGDMPGYIGRRFKTDPLNDAFSISHWEQDGLIQRVLNEDGSQTVAPGIAKCSHVGAVRSYGDDREEDYERFFGFAGLRFDERVERIEQFIADPYWRAQAFGREIVEREIGRELPKREFRYTVRLPGGWEASYVSELSWAFLPKRILSVPIPSDAEIVLSS